MALYLVVKNPPFGRRCNRAHGTIQKRQAELSFQSIDSTRNRRLRLTDGRGGFGKTLQFTNQNKKNRIGIEKLRLHRMAPHRFISVSCIQIPFLHYSVVSAPSGWPIPTKHKEYSEDKRTLRVLPYSILQSVWFSGFLRSLEIFPNPLAET